MSLFRSEEMTMCQLYVQTESVYSVVTEFGELGIAQFNDLNPLVAFHHRLFTKELRRCQEMERKLVFIKSQLDRNHDLKIEDNNEEPPAPKSGEQTDLETALEKVQEEILQMDTNTLELRKTHVQLTELRHILRSMEHFFLENSAPTSADLDEPVRPTEHQNDPNVAVGTTEAVALTCLAGMVHCDKAITMERMLWRICRGNVFFRPLTFIQVIDPVTDQPVKKISYVMFFSGSSLLSKLRKVCQAFHATVHEGLDDGEKRRRMTSSIAEQLTDIDTILNQSKAHKQAVLVIAAKNYLVWRAQVRKAKANYHVMNMLNGGTQKTLVAECWIPVKNLQEATNAIVRGTTGSSVGSIIQQLETTQTPPTSNRLNKFTEAWQNIVDAYGYNTYREINPAIFTMATFPFLFAVMYGDAGHGLLVTLASLTMCVKEKFIQSKKIRDDIFNMFFNGRYVLLSMGLMSIYTGSIYNEMFSKSFDVFGSKWFGTKPNETCIDCASLNPITDYRQYPYPYGLDPVWSMAQNKLTFQNSFKMKISVIIGIFQMLFGLMISLGNYKQFRNYGDIFCRFIPQFLFLVCIFLYLVILILFKWIVFNAGGRWLAVGYYPGSHCAPDLLIGLINMIMLKPRPKGFNEFDCPSAAFYPYQTIVERSLIITAFICIPWMLLSKPLMQKYMSWKLTRRRPELDIDLRVIHAESNDSGSVQDTRGNEESATFSLAEAFIAEAIHTVEYCLGLVSHTASYLRLWALSLAHSELATVLWTMVMRQAFKSSSYLGALAVYLVFMAFAVLTVIILVFMDSLSVFLHALRLHWVEFQSKFYQGLGRPFEPFSYKQIALLDQEQMNDQGD